jgi:hypothetical protein
MAAGAQLLAIGVAAATIAINADSMIDTLGMLSDGVEQNIIGITSIAGSAIAHGASMTGSAIAHGASMTGSAIAHGASMTGSAIAHGASMAGSAIAHGASMAGSAVRSLFTRPQIEAAVRGDQPLMAAFGTAAVTAVTEVATANASSGGGPPTPEQVATAVSSAVHAPAVEAASAALAEKLVAAAPGAKVTVNTSSQGSVASLRAKFAGKGGSGGGSGGGVGGGGSSRRKRRQSRRYK